MKEKNWIQSDAKKDWDEQRQIAKPIPSWLQGDYPRSFKGLLDHTDKWREYVLVETYQHPIKNEPLTDMVIAAHTAWKAFTGKNPYAEIRIRDKYDDFIDSLFSDFTFKHRHSYYGSFGTLNNFRIVISPEDECIHAFDLEGEHHEFKRQEDIPSGWYFLDHGNWFYRMIHRFRLITSQVPAAYRLFLMVNQIDQPE